MGPFWEDIGARKGTDAKGVRQGPRPWGCGLSLLCQGSSQAFQSKYVLLLKSSVMRWEIQSSGCRYFFISRCDCFLSPCQIKRTSFLGWALFTVIINDLRDGVNTEPGKPGAIANTWENKRMQNYKS